MFDVPFVFIVRINDTVTFLEDGYDEDIEFGYEVSDEGEDNAVDAVSTLHLFYTVFHKFIPVL